jgi:hypothetical protein
MNACFNTIAEYMEPKEAMKLRRKFVKRFFPHRVELNGIEEVNSFYKMCNTFDTEHLEEVRIVILQDYSGSIGWVPPSVKKLSIYADCIVSIEIPNTVEELIMELYPYYQSLSLPDSIQKLTLKYNFDSVIHRWPANLKELRMKGWCTGNGRWPVPIDHLPDNITHMTLDNDLDVTINHWPEQLEELVLEGSETYLSMAEELWPHTNFKKFVKVLTNPTSE